MTYTLGNKCAKNLCKRIVLLQLIIENVVTCFFGTQCIVIHALDLLIYAFDLVNEEVYSPCMPSITACTAVQTVV